MALVNRFSRQCTDVTRVIVIYLINPAHSRLTYNGFRLCFNIFWACLFRNPSLLTYGWNDTKRSSEIAYSEILLYYCLDAVGTILCDLCFLPREKCRVSVEATYNLQSIFVWALFFSRSDACSFFPDALQLDWEQTDRWSIFSFPWIIIILFEISFCPKRKKIHWQRVSALVEPLF